MYRYNWLINVGCICGLIVFVGCLAPKENTVTSPPKAKPVVKTQPCSKLYPCRIA